MWNKSIEIMMRKRRISVRSKHVEMNFSKAHFIIQNKIIEIMMFSQEEKKTKWAFKHAERLGSTHLVMIGDQEDAAGMVKVKDLASGEQKDVPVTEITQHFSFLTK
jgi:histidyl-tRNA synthetase